MLILKIMCANRGNDTHPRHGHQLFADVNHVNFIEPTRSDPQAWVRFHCGNRNAAEDEIVLPLEGNVYVLNEAGRTISSFEVNSAAKPTGRDPKFVDLPPGAGTNY